MAVAAISMAVMIIAIMRISDGVEYDVATNEVIATASKRNVTIKSCLASLFIIIRLPLLFFIYYSKEIINCVQFIPNVRYFIPNVI